MGEYKSVISSLLVCGYAYLPIDTALVSNANSAASLFLQAKMSVWGDWAFTRPGDEFPSVGIIHEARSGEPDRSALYFTHDLPHYASKAKVSEGAPYALECIRVVERLYKHLQSRAGYLVFELDKHSALSNLPSRVKTSFGFQGQCRPTELRLLSGTQVQSVCEEGQIDPGLLTFHLGAESGDIQIQDERSGNWFLATPPQGSVLVFFGNKVNDLGNPELRPIRHKSMAASGKPYLATYMIVEADTTEIVPDVDKTNVLALSRSG